MLSIDITFATFDVIEEIFKTQSLDLPFFEPKIDPHIIRSQNYPALIKSLLYNLNPQRQFSGCNI